MDIKLDVHTGLACSWSVVLIYNRDHGRWSQAECPDWSVQSRVCLMPQYSNASCTKLKSHVLLICEGPQGVTTWNVMYIYIYTDWELNVSTKPCCTPQLHLLPCSQAPAQLSVTYIQYRMESWGLGTRLHFDWLHHRKLSKTGHAVIDQRLDGKWS